MFKIPEHVENKYEFVTLAAKRAEQLQMGAVPRVELQSNKVTVVAQGEVAGGFVTALDPEQDAVDSDVEEE